jgi:ELWxxDGT repeat protein
MPAKRSLALALALLLVAAIPVRGASFPAITVVDTIRPGVDGSYALWNSGRLGDYLYFGGDDGVNGYELWHTNGTTTELVQDINTGNSGADSSSPSNLTALGDFLYFNAADGTTAAKVWRINGIGAAESAVIPGTNAGVGCMCDPLSAVDGRLFVTMWSDETGSEFAYLDEPTFVLPETNRNGSAWSTALALLAAVTAVAGAGLRIRGVRRG